MLVAYRVCKMRTFVGGACAGELANGLEFCRRDTYNCTLVKSFRRRLRCTTRASVVPRERSYNKPLRWINGNDGRMETFVFVWLLLPRRGRENAVWLGLCVCVCVCVCAWEGWKECGVVRKKRNFLPIPSEKREEERAQKRKKLTFVQRKIDRRLVIAVIFEANARHRVPNCRRVSNVN